jgi:hypothetical protein
MMQARLAINAVVLVLSAGASVQTATACPKEAVAGAVDRWTTVLAENNPDTIVALRTSWEPSKRCRNSPSNLESSLSAYMEIPRSTRAPTHYSTQRTAKPNQSLPATVSHS